MESKIRQILSKDLQIESSNAEVEKAYHFGKLGKLKELKNLKSRIIAAHFLRYKDK